MKASLPQLLLDSQNVARRKFIIPTRSCRDVMIIWNVIHFLAFGGSFLVSQTQRHFQECVTCYVNSPWPTAWNANSVTENCFVFHNIQKSRGQGSWRYVACEFVFTMTESFCILKQLRNFIKLNQLVFFTFRYQCRSFIKEENLENVTNDSSKYNSGCSWLICVLHWSSIIST